MRVQRLNAIDFAATKEPATPAARTLPHAVHDGVNNRCRRRTRTLIGLRGGHVVAVRNLDGLGEGVALILQDCDALEQVYAEALHSEKPSDKVRTERTPVGAQ